MKKTKSKDTGKYVTVCPKCGSTNVYPDLSKDMVAWGGSTRWACGDCDYSAPVFPEISQSKLGQVKKGVKGRTKEDEKVIDELSVSKGITNKKVNQALLVINLAPVVVLVIFIVLAFMYNYLWVIPGVTFYGLFVLWRRSKKKE